MAEEPGFVVLGGEMAAAEAAEQLHRAGQHDVSPLAGVRYDARAMRLWRWVASPVDKRIQDTVSEYQRVSDRSAVRASLTMNDLYTILAYARRIALDALRTREPRKAEEAMASLALIDLSRIDWRDLHRAAIVVCHAARRLGLDPGAMAAAAGSTADAVVAEHLSKIGHDRPDLARGAGFQEVIGTDGPVLLDTNLAMYEPTIDLVAPALSTVDIIDADRYVTNAVTCAVGPDAWWLRRDSGAAAPEALDRVRAGVSIRGTKRGNNDGLRAPYLMGYLVEAVDERDSKTIAGAANAASRADVALLGVSHGRWYALLLARTPVANAPAPESGESLERFRIALTHVLSTVQDQDHAP
jgi:hypothetical protein